MMYMCSMILPTYLGKIPVDFPKPAQRFITNRVLWYLCLRGMRVRSNSDVKLGSGLLVANWSYFIPI